jgi:hypothetical protein
MPDKSILEHAHLAFPCSWFGFRKSAFQDSERITMIFLGASMDFTSYVDTMISNMQARNVEMVFVPPKALIEKVSAAIDKVSL